MNVVHGTVSGTGSVKGSVSTIYGKDGISPTIEVDYTCGVHLLRITDVNGTKLVEIDDGKDGSDGASAYDFAIANGFEGSDEEWLASLKGETGNSGVYIGSGDMPEDCNVQIDPNGDTLGIEDIKRLLGVQTPKIAYIQLLASAWEGADGLYSQVVTIDGTTAYSKVDLLPSVEQLAIFHNKDVAFVTENDKGVVTVYAIGDKPLLDYTMQVQITEVTV